MKYFCLLFSIVALNATITITPLIDQAPRPNHIQKQTNPQPIQPLIPQTQTQTQDHKVTIIEENTSQQKPNIPAKDVSPVPEEEVKVIFAFDKQLQTQSSKPVTPQTQTLQPDYNYYYGNYGNPNHKSHNHKDNKEKHRPQPKRQPQYGYQNSPIYEFSSQQYNNDDFQIMFAILFILSILIPILLIAACIGIWQRMIRRRDCMRNKMRPFGRHPNQANQYPNYVHHHMNPQTIQAQIQYHETEMARLQGVLVQQRQRQAYQHQHQQSFEQRQNYQNNQLRNFNYVPHAGMQPEMMVPNYISLNDESQIPVGRPIREGQFDYPRL